MIKLDLTVEETNVLLAALGNLPYVQSANLIHKIQDIAKKTLTEAQNENTKTITATP